MIEGFSDKLLGLDLAVTFPKYINIRRGTYTTALASIACNPSVQTQGRWPLRWQPLEYILVFIWVQLARACSLGFGYLPVVTRIHCQCQPESWNGRGFIPCYLDMFLHRRGHKFCCGTLSLSCPVSPGTGRFTAICSKTMCEVYDLKEGIEIIDKTNDKEFILLSAEEKDLSDKSLSCFYCPHHWYESKKLKVPSISKSLSSGCYSDFRRFHSQKLSWLLPAAPLTLMIMDFQNRQPPLKVISHQE